MQPQEDRDPLGERGRRPYQGGIVNEATGKELPGANTGLYKISADEAEQIDWSDQDALSEVDWSTYRKFCHQAFQ